MVLRRPVAQAIQHHAAHNRVVAVERVAGAAEVEIVAIRRQHVVDLVVEPAERDIGSHLVAFSGVVKHHVQKHLNTGPVQLLDEVLELIGLHAQFAGCRIAGLGGEEANRAVSPVLHKHLTGCFADPTVLELVELIDRQQLDAIDTQLFQVRDLLAQAGKRAGELHTRRRMLGEPAHMRLVDHEILGRNLQRLVAFPIEVVEQEARAVLVDVIPVRLLAPHVAPAEGLGIGIAQDLGRVKAIAGSWIERPIHAIAILNILVVKAKNYHRPHIADAVVLRKGNLDPRLGSALVEQHQGTRSRAARIHREVGAAGHHCGAKGNWLAGP